MNNQINVERRAREAYLLGEVLALRLKHHSKEAYRLASSQLGVSQTKAHSLMRSGRLWEVPQSSRLQDKRCLVSVASKEGGRREGRQGTEVDFDELGNGLCLAQGEIYGNPKSKAVPRIWVSDGTGWT